MTGALTASYQTINYWPETQFKYDVIGVVRNKTQMFYSISTVFQSYRDYQKNVLPLLNTNEYRPELRKFHVRTAERIYSLCIRSKGVYIKFGQYISTLDRIIPKEVSDVLKRLQDSCPPHSLETMKIVLDTNISDWKDFIFELEEKPIGSASLAQVHRAKLVDGSIVAIKLQYPELRLQFDLDISTLSFLARNLTRYLKWYDVNFINMEDIFEKFRTSVQNEMNFYIEVNNSDKMRGFLKNNLNVIIPRVKYELSSKRVITMDYISGTRIDDNRSIKEVLHLNTNECGQILVDLYLSMIFKYGYIHCDPHPGNILVRNHPFDPKRPQIVLLDHGFYRYLKDDVRKNFAELWISLINRDDKRIKVLAKWFGIEQKANYLSIIFLFRTKNVQKIGDGFSPEEINRLRDKDVLSLMNVGHMLDEFSEDILMIIRTMNMIGSRNLSLGNNNRERILKTTKIVYNTHYEHFLVWRLAFYWFRVRLWVYERFFFIIKILQKPSEFDL